MTKLDYANLESLSNIDALRERFGEFLDVLIPNKDFDGAPGRFDRPWKPKPINEEDFVKSSKYDVIGVWKEKITRQPYQTIRTDQGNLPLVLAAVDTPGLSEPLLVGAVGDPRSLVPGTSQISMFPVNVEGNEKKIPVPILTGPGFDIDGIHPESITHAFGRTLFAKQKMADLTEPKNLRILRDSLGNVVDLMVPSNDVEGPQGPPPPLWKPRTLLASDVLKTFPINVDFLKNELINNRRLKVPTDAGDVPLTFASMSLPGINRPLVVGSIGDPRELDLNTWQIDVMPVQTKDAKIIPLPLFSKPSFNADNIKSEEISEALIKSRQADSDILDMSDPDYFNILYPVVGPIFDMMIPNTNMNEPQGPKTLYNRQRTEPIPIQRLFDRLPINPQAIKTRLQTMPRYLIEDEDNNRHALRFAKLNLPAIELPIPFALVGDPKALNTDWIVSSVPIRTSHGRMAPLLLFSGKVLLLNGLLPLIL